MMPAKKRVSKAAFTLSPDALRAAWLGGGAFRDLFEADTPIAWERLRAGLSKIDPLPAWNVFWDLSEDIPGGLRTPDPLDWGAAGDGLRNLYETIWMRRASWLLRHPDVLSAADWARLRAGSKAKYLKRASKEVGDE